MSEKYCWMFGEHKNDPCPCGYTSKKDPEKIIATLRAEIARKDALLQAVMNEQDSDWWSELQDWPNERLLEMEVPIGWIRQVAEELNAKH